MKKSYYNLLARLLPHPSWSKWVSKLLFSTRSPIGQQQPGVPQDEFPRAISIWLPEEQDGETVFIRPRQQVFGDHYSDTRSFKQQKAPGVTRVCYFGESAALGYLYAPGFSPAKYLEQALNTPPTDRGYEVIDLSMTNETLDSMLEKITAAVQLEPDILVVFSGNNWALMESETPPQFPQYAVSHLETGRLLKKRGVDALSDQVVKQRLEKIGRTYAAINSISEEIRAQVIIVVPEVNLKDWESRQPPPFLPGTSTNDWFQLYTQCCQKLEEADWAGGLELAFRMWDLDQGSCATTYRLIALAHLNAGDLPKARAASRAEIGRTILPFMVYLNSPQITSYEQQVLRRTAERFDFKLVDLPREFESRTGGELPGRELFFDYCHYTKQGIRWAVEAISREIIGISSEDCPEVPHQMPDTQIPAEHQALAEFGAAVHTAHRLTSISDKSELLRYWCRKAYTSSPGIASVMVDFMLARTKLTPAVLTEAQQRILQSPYPLPHSHGWKYPHLDIEIILAILETLRPDFPEIEEQITASLLEFHAVEKRSYDLAGSSKYLWNPLEQSYLDLLQPENLDSRAFLRSFWPGMDFVLISEAVAELGVMAVVRQENAAADQEMQLRVNGRQVGAAPVGDTFSRLNFTIPRHYLTRGINKLTFIWPALASGDKGLGEAVRRLDAGYGADLSPVFGELYSLKISPAGSTSDLA